MEDGPGGRVDMVAANITAIGGSRLYAVVLGSATTSLTFNGSVPVKAVE